MIEKSRRKMTRMESVTVTTITCVSALASSGRGAKRPNHMSQDILHPRKSGTPFLLTPGDANFPGGGK